MGCRSPTQLQRFWSDRHEAGQTDMKLVGLTLCGRNDGGIMGIAQLLESLTENLGAILTWVRVLSVARDFSPRVNFQRGLSYGVQPHAST